MTITVGAPTHPASERLYGVFFEDINHGADGGLNANMVDNYSFDGVYVHHESLRLKGADRWRTEADPLRGWRFDGLTVDSCGTEIRGEHGQRVMTDCPAPPIHRNSRYVRITIGGPRITEGSAYPSIENYGYCGDLRRAGLYAMSIVRGHTYDVTAYVRPVNGTVSLRVTVIGDDDRPISDDVYFDVDRFAGESMRDGWVRVRYALTGLSSGYGALHVDVIGEPGAVFDLDCVSLMDADSWGAGDPKWRHGRMRRDLVESIAALKPAFVRFPGGCIVEGVTPGNEYRWKDTVGALPARRQQANMWGYKTPDGGMYSQSYQIGFYEYFCLCEDLGARPLPTLFAGISCQSPYRDPQHMPIDSPAFRAVIDDYLDLIDFANGDPAKGEWAAVRAAMGHPAPFGLDMIGVGNENFGADYLAKFDSISSAIHERYPSVLCVMSAGLFPFALPMRPAWSHARTIAAGSVPGATGELLAARGSATGEAVMVDEHSYHSPEWFVSEAARFDDYPRCGAGVYFGEYSANGFLAAQPQTLARANRWESALAEAAFLTGCERNADVVRMTSYAPLLALVGGRQWNQNLIEFSPSRVSPTVNYEAERLFSAHVGGMSYAVSREGDGGASDGTLFVSATGGDAPFRRFVKVVNTGADAVPLTLAVAMGDAPGVRRVRLTVRTLMGAPHARNTLDFEGEPARSVTSRTNVSHLPVDEGRPLRFALSVKPHSVTLVVLEE